MLRNRTYRGIAAIASFVAIGTFAAGGCTGTPAPDGTTSTSTTSTTGQGGGGGTVTTGGMGTGGDPGPCGTDCSLINTPDCQVAQCNVQTGMCEVVNDEDGNGCDDGVFCTISDSCLAGKCAGGPPNDCGMTPPQCNEVACDETSQTCTAAPSMTGSACQDPNDLCQKGMTCTNGLCIGGAPEDCFFFPVPSDCHVASCNSTNGMCEAVPGNEGQNCVDLMDLCTLSKTCATGVCQGGSPKDCSQLTQGCDIGTCDTMNGNCTTIAVMNGQPCDDLSACTLGETCSNQTCSNGTPVTVCEMNGDGCCPGNCTINNDLDCAVQPSCNDIKQTIPASLSGIYTIDPDGPGPAQQMQVYCDMTSQGGGWTLLAKIAGANTEGWQWDTAAWTGAVGFGGACVLDTVPGCDGKSDAWAAMTFDQLQVDTGLSIAFYDMVTLGLSMQAHFVAFPDFTATGAGQVLANRFAGDTTTNYALIAMGDGDTATISSTSADRCMFHVRSTTSQTASGGFCAGRVRNGVTNTFVSFPTTVNTNNRADYAQMANGGSATRGETMMIYAR
jgi:hypothetical protein